MHARLLEGGPSYEGVTAAHHPIDVKQRWVDDLERQLHSSPWNASSVDADAAELLAARRALAAVEEGGAHAASSDYAMALVSHDPALLSARRKVVALEYRLGCKMGVVSAIDIASSSSPQQAVHRLVVSSRV